MGIIIDKKPRNVAALRGYSYDEEAYFNHHAKPLVQYYTPQPKPTKATSYKGSGNSVQSQVEFLINEITSKRIDLTATYDDWISLAFAFLHEFGENGRSYFHDISSTYAGYDYNETDEQFDKCKAAAEVSKPITIKTFFAKCKDAGIMLPKSDSKAQEKTARFKVKKEAPQLLQLHSKDMLTYGNNYKTGAEFNEVIMAMFYCKDGKAYDVLFDKYGEWIRPGEQEEIVNKLAAHFNKNFQPFIFDDNLCLAHEILPYKN